MANSSLNKEEPTKSSVNKSSPPKKSRTLLWILLIGFAILIIIIIVIVIAVVFGGTDTNTPVPPPTPPTPPSPATCSSIVGGITVPYPTGAPTPILVENGPNYLTDPGNITGSTSNPEIVTSNALGWIFRNNSNDSIFLIFYYIDKFGEPQEKFSGGTAPPNSIMSWTYNETSEKKLDTKNPVFRGMTVKAAQNAPQPPVSINSYTIPTSGDLDINQSSDIVELTYNTDNIITGSICRQSS